MGWSTVPLSAGDAGVIAAMTEVKAAFDERYDAVGASFGKPTAVTAGDFGDWSDVIAHYHSKIESLLTSFYQKSGSGESTTFAAWTLGTLMTACFGAGVTDWRDDAEGLATIRQVNDLRTALNKLTWVRATISSARQAYEDDSGPALGSSAQNAQDDYDAATTQKTTTTLPWAGCGAFDTVGDWGSSWMPYIQYTYIPDNPPASQYTMGPKPIRDSHYIGSFVAPDITITDLGIEGTAHHYEDDNPLSSPDNATTLTLYLGTSSPGTTYSAITSYGTLAGSQSFSASYNGSTATCSLTTSSVAGDSTNYLRATFRGTVNRDLNDVTWPTYSVDGFANCGFTFAPQYVYLQAQFSYRAA